LSVCPFFFTGEFQAYWRWVFGVTKEQRHDYGTLPNKATFDVKWREKRMKAAMDPSNPFNPFSDDDHYVWCALENIMFEFNTRGCLEPSSICVEDFETGIIEEGAFKGIPFVRLKENYSGQKGKALSLRNHVQDAANTKKKTFACPYSSDRLSCYQTTLKLIEWTPPEANGRPRRIFRKKASKAELEEWEQAGKKYRLSSKPSRVIGKCQINKLLKKVAVWCNYDNPNRCTAHGKRAAGISTCANAGVGPAILKMTGGHASIDMVAAYHAPTQEGFDHAIKAKHGSPSKIREDFGEHGDLIGSDDDDSTMDALKDIEPYSFHPVEDSKPHARSIPAYASAPGNLLVNNTRPFEQEDSKPAALYASMPVASVSVLTDSTNVAYAVKKKKKKKKKRRQEEPAPPSYFHQEQVAPPPAPPAPPAPPLYYHQEQVAPPPAPRSYYHQEQAVAPPAPRSYYHQEQAAPPPAPRRFQHRQLSRSFDSEYDDYEEQRHYYEDDPYQQDPPEHYYTAPRQRPPPRTRYQAPTRPRPRPRPEGTISYHYQEELFQQDRPRRVSHGGEIFRRPPQGYQREPSPPRYHGRRVSYD
jgi:hypothetical protein